MDIEEIQARCREIRKEMNERSARLSKIKKTPPQQESTPVARRDPRPLDRWAHLKDYPGQRLSGREFRARLEAHREAQRLERQLRYYAAGGGFERDCSYGPKKSDWRRKPKRRK